MKALFLIFISCSLPISKQQEIIWLNKNQIDSLKERVFIVAKDSSGRKFGAGGDITAKPLYIYFEYFKYNSSSMEIEAKGGTCSFIDKEDTLLLGNVKIFKAKNQYDTLSMIESLVNNINNERNPLREGEFYFKTQVDSVKKLYFVGVYTRIYEFDLPRLLKLFSSAH
jgi:hypothetical protein